VRLGFAVATAADPDVLVVDEILAVGDEAFVHKCLDRIARLQRRGTSIVLVSHDLALVEQLAHRALYLDAGRPAMLGGAGAVVARYRSDVASTEAGQEAAEATARRWGNGDVMIERVELLDETGRPARLVECGRAATIRFVYSVHRPQEDFVFGVAIHREDGAQVFGTNTDLDGWRPESLAGRGEVRLDFPDLALAPGRYLVDVAVHAKGGLAYDYVCEALSFTVTSPVPWPGTYAPRHRWVPDGPRMTAPDRDTRRD
jgi:homopolymeric O-antigen transport system ATP-binding protein